MLLVGDSMTREIVTVMPETTAADALRVCRERGIRHLPVLEDGRLAGIVSDRDLRSATPALGDPERAAALERIRVGEVMNRDVVTARPDDPIEHAAREMFERKIGCLPVVESDELVGILTASDVMRAFVRLTGAHEPGELAEVAGIVRDANVNIVSVLAAPDLRDGKRVAVLRLATIDPHRVVEELERAGYPILWPPRS